MKIPTSHFAKISPEKLAKLILNKRKFEADSADFEAGKTTPAKPRARHKYGENDIQKAVAKFLDFIGVQWEHTPNEGFESGAKYGSKMKEFGMKAGSPDIKIYNPSFDGHYVGFAIELKYGKNQLSGKQQTWLNSLARCGWHIAVCYSTDDAIKEVEKYFNIKPPYPKIALP